MSKVVASGSAILVLIFCFVGLFGYATFSLDLGQLCSVNILAAPMYSDVSLMQISNFAMLFSVISSFPLVILPSKDSIEELFFEG
jgi:amino acid permease